MRQGCIISLVPSAHTLYQVYSDEGLDPSAINFTDNAKVRQRLVPPLLHSPGTPAHARRNRCSSSPSGSGSSGGGPAIAAMSVDQSSRGWLGARRCWR